VKHFQSVWVRDAVNVPFGSTLRRGSEAAGFARIALRNKSTLQVGIVDCLDPKISIFLVSWWGELLEQLSFTFVFSLCSKQRKVAYSPPPPNTHPKIFPSAILSDNRIQKSLSYCVCPPCREYQVILIISFKTCTLSFVDSIKNVDSLFTHHVIYFTPLTLCAKYNDELSKMTDYIFPPPPSPQLWLLQFHIKNTNTRQRQSRNRSSVWNGILLGGP